MDFFGVAHMFHRRLASAAFCFFATAALADDPWSTLNTYESVTVNATPAAAFAVVSKWEALESWCPAFSKTTIISGGNAVGSVREITLKDGPSFTEELLATDKAELSYKYKIIDSPLPIVDYQSTVRVVSAGGQTSIVWLSSYKRRARENPSPEQGDAAMMNLVGGLYRACLGNARKVAESR